jgi:transposase
MPGSAAKVVITERQQKILQEIVNSRTSALRLVQRATIVLQGFAGVDNADIAQELGLGPDCVGLWRRRWAKVWPRLTLFECAETPADLRRALTAVLDDKPRSGNPGTFTPEQITQILALACEDPELSGRPITHWTNAELAHEAQKRGIVASISPSQVGRYLREAELQPHRSKYWLNTKEKDPVVFQAKVEEVCDCYLEAPRLYAEENTHTVCTDEMTGIQALERIAPKLPTGKGKTECREFEYARHGTVTLIGNFHVVTGELIAPTLGPTRTEADFVQHVAQTVSIDPGASWVFVVDNLNIHGSESLVQWVAKSCSIEQDLGKKRQRGSAAIASDAARVSIEQGASHPLRVFAQAHVVAEPS